MNITISYEKLKTMLKETYQQGRHDQLNEDFPDVGIQLDYNFEESKAGKWIEETNESNKRKGIGQTTH